MVVATAGPLRWGVVGIGGDWWGGGHPGLIRGRAFPRVLEMNPNRRPAGGKRGQSDVLLPWVGLSYRDTGIRALVF